MKAKKKLYSVLMAGTMVISAIPGTAFAAEEHICEYVRAEAAIREGSCTVKGIWKEIC